MYNMWQDCLLEDSLRKERHEERRQARRERKERKLMKLQRELQMRQKQEAVANRRSSTATCSSTMGREAYDTMDEVSKNVHGRRDSSWESGSHQEDSPSRLSSILLTPNESENPSPSRSASERVTAGSVKRPNLKFWAGNVLRGAAPKRSSCLVTGTVIKEGGVPTPELPYSLPSKVLRKSVSSPHLSHGAGKSTPPSVGHQKESRGTKSATSGFLVQQQNTLANEAEESIPIDILSDVEGHDTQDAISSALTGELDATSMV